MSEGFILVDILEHVAVKRHRSAQAVLPHRRQLHTLIIIGQTSALSGDLSEGDYGKKLQY